jgi:NAD(P)-dependent dehydrogenase (short-subunit alcohol dehydrogenase family)
MKKVVVVTGASSGIGRAAAMRLAEKGFHVLAGVRRERDAERWRGVDRATPLLLDVASDASVEAALAKARPLLEGAGEVHLVNNAGIAVAGPVEAVPIARWKEQFEVNVFGLLRITQALLPSVRATAGRIVNISSVSGLAAAPYMGPYSASKFAVEALSDALRRELRQFGCRVIVVEPGPIATPIWEKNLGQKDPLLGDLTPELRKAYGRELARFEKGAEKTARGAAPVDRVSDVIEKALSAERPRTRYVVGAKTLPAQMALAGLLPDKWVDALVAREFR